MGVRLNRRNRCMNKKCIIMQLACLIYQDVKQIRSFYHAVYKKMFNLSHIVSGFLWRLLKVDSERNFECTTNLLYVDE